MFSLQMDQAANSRNPVA